MATNSPILLPSLPEAFSAGEPMTILGIPVQTDWLVSGSQGTAVITASSVDLIGSHEVVAPNVPDGAEDKFSQSVHWHRDATHSRGGNVELSVMKHKKSADGLVEQFFNMTYARNDSNIQDTINGIFRQRDGAWVRQVQFEAIGGSVFQTTTTIGYENNDEKLTLSYTLGGIGATAQNVPEWTGKYDNIMDQDGRQMRVIASAKRTGEGAMADKEARAAFGVQQQFIGSQRPGWMTFGTGMQDLHNQPHHHWGEYGILAPVINPFTQEEVWVGAYGSYSNSNSSTPGSYITSQFLPKDKPAFLFGVQQAHDSGGVSLIIIPPQLPLLPLLP